MFDGIPISMFLVSKSEPKMMEYGFKPRSWFDKKHGILDIVFLSQFTQKHLRKCGCTRWIELNVKKFVRFRIDSSIQPVALIVELDNVSSSET